MIPIKNLENDVLYWGETEYPMFWKGTIKKFVMAGEELEYDKFNAYKECLKPDDVSKKTKNKIIVLYSKIDNEFKQLYKAVLFELLMLKNQYHLQYRILSFYSNLGSEYIKIYKNTAKEIEKNIFSVKTPERRYFYFTKVLKVKINTYDYRPKSSFVKTDKQSICENWEEMKKLLDKKDS